MHINPTKLAAAQASGSLLQLASGLWVSRALWVAAHLRIADHVSGQPISVDELAAATNCEPDALRRLLTALASIGVFVVGTDERVSHTMMSALMQSDHPTSQRAFLESIFGHEHYAAWGEIERSLRTGGCGFDAHFGKSSFDWYAENPGAAALFGEAMTGATTAMEDAVLAAYDFGQFELGVDVGGSHGTLIRNLLAQTPLARGILFDLPGTVADAERAWQQTAADPRLTALSGDFFESVPAEGDLYLLKFILHDWSDERSVTILSNIRAAIRPGGRVAILEMVLPDDPARPHPGRFVDLNMLAVTGGRERSAAQYDKLLRTAGFMIESVTETASPMSIIIARLQ